MEYPVRSFIKFGQSYTPHWNLDILKEEIDSDITQAQAEEMVKYNPYYARSGFFHQTLTHHYPHDRDELAVKKFMPTGTWNIFFVSQRSNTGETWEVEGVMDNYLHEVNPKYLEEPEFWEWDTDDFWTEAGDDFRVFNYSFDIDPTCESGFVKLSCEGMTKTVSWERQGDGSFIMTDFEGRTCRVDVSGKVYEIFKSAEDLLWTVYQEQRDLCKDFSQHIEWTEEFKRLAEDLKSDPNMSLPTVVWGNESIVSNLPESLIHITQH
tara:strand:- start:1723 stop:2517 length:795 start_codon:yes stop_codon:yes gene_type:complete